MPTSYEYDSAQETQLLYGEVLNILSESGEWLRVEAVEQQEFSHNGLWEGYPGWIKKDCAVTVNKIPSMNSVTVKKITRLYQKPDSDSSYLLLSIGTKLNAQKIVKNGFRKILTVSGKTGWVVESTIRFLYPALSEEKSRKSVIESAFEFMGDPYFWGGRSSHIPELISQVTAVDCSGFVNLSYRAAGIEIPRDSYEQYLKSRKIKREELKAGDLIFTAPKDKPEKVSHVTIFLDKNYIIEAPKTGEVVRKIEFEIKYGLPLNQVENAQIVNDRIVYFGSFFSPP